MTELAACESPLFKATDMEGRREGLSFSIDTLKEFHRFFTNDLQLYFIMGLDAFLEIETWREYRQLFHYAHFVVIQRPGLPSEQLEPFMRSLQFSYESEGESGPFRMESGYTVIYKKATLMDISSTDIRERVAVGRSIRFLVPEAVRSYIMDKGLYQRA
jgi:nicotinate-nucleotide adenylyltransferase